MSKTPPKKFRRWRVFAEPKIQTALCIRIAIYWVCCQAAMVCTMLYLAALDGGASGGSLMRLITPALVVSGCVLPLALVDLLILSNRIVGPIKNFRNRFHNFVHKHVAEEMSLRSDDYYKELQDDFNVLCREYNSMMEQREQNGLPRREAEQHAVLN